MRAWACVEKKHENLRSAFKNGDTVYVDPTRTLARKRCLSSEKIVRIEIAEVK